jgi:hypothetical protein
VNKADRIKAYYGEAYGLLLGQWVVFLACSYIDFINVRYLVVVNSIICGLTRLTLGIFPYYNIIGSSFEAQQASTVNNFSESII